jgi:alanine racemase
MTISATRSLRRSAWLEIDLDALRHNISSIKALVAPAGVAPVVKADAYGHGVERVGPALADAVEALCVATLDEALALRALVPGRVLLLYPVPPTAAGEAVHAGIELVVMSAADLSALQAAASDDRPPVGLHLCVESGMHRGGLSRDELAAVATVAQVDPRFKIVGLWTHLASPEDPDSARAQVARFELAAGALREAGLAIPARHIAASGGIFSPDVPGLDLVRPGLATYGALDEASPIAAEATATAGALRPALALKAHAVAFSEVPEGGSVGYGDTWRAERPSRVAILPLGYADGYLRGAQPGAEVLVRGSRRPLVGIISMDAVAVDVTDEPGLDASAEFVLLGRQGAEVITAGELARRRNTITWEVLASMAQRLDRVYYPGAGAALPE